jgi:deoxyribodipyrimidine photo-lyase
MNSTEKVSIFWFRRDLRLEDNHGLFQALQGEHPVLPIFIFDENIINELAIDDPRISFIYKQLANINTVLLDRKTSLYCCKGNPTEVFKKLLTEFDVQEVYINEDYEPYAKIREQNISDILAEKNIFLKKYKDQVIFAKDEVLKNDQTPYTVFTPYKNKWLSIFKPSAVLEYPSVEITNFTNKTFTFPSLQELGFKKSTIKVHDYNISDLENYKTERNFPALNKTSYLSPHLRFGTVSIRKIIKQVLDNEQFLFELIWREFFMQILFHFPHVVTSNFRNKYDLIKWRNSPK